MEEESILDANNVPAETFSHSSNTQRENANTIFTSEKLDKWNKLADTLEDLSINGAKYYESDTATASETQGDPKRNPKTVTHTRNGKGKVTDTSNRNFEQKLLSNQIIPDVVLTMNPRIYQKIVPIVVAPKTLLTPATEEVFADAESGSVWINRTHQRVSMAGVNGSTSGNICNTISV